jgi:NAD(P)H-flavin reductase
MASEASAARRVSALLRQLAPGAARRRRGLGVRPQRVAGAARRREYTAEQVAAKRAQGLLWIVIHGKVYDVTEFIEEHPGGAEIITDIPWDDFETMNMEFDDADHSDEALEDMKELYKGRLAGYEAGEGEEAEGEDDDEGEEGEDEQEAEGEEEGEVEEAPRKKAAPAAPSAQDQLTPFYKFQELELPLIDKHAISHDVSVFRFALPTPTHRLGLPTGQHIILAFAGEDGALVTRPYTPVSPKGEQGFVDFVVKLYPNGKMSRHLSRLEIGQSIVMRGPKGKLEYAGRGQFIIRKKDRKLRHIGMVAGGSVRCWRVQLWWWWRWRRRRWFVVPAAGGLTLTPLFSSCALPRPRLRRWLVSLVGLNLLALPVCCIVLLPFARQGLTPMFQILQQVASDLEDDLQITLLYANKSEGDILLRNALETFARARPKTIKIHYTLDAPPSNWKGFKGFVSKEMLSKTMPKPGPDSMVLLCGPPPMIKKACIPALGELGYGRDHLFTF